MKKKFSFNFNFLDRFKKKPTALVEENFDEIEQEEISEEISIKTNQSISEEVTADVAVATMKEALTSTSTSEKTSPNIPIPEEFPIPQLDLPETKKPTLKFPKFSKPNFNIFGRTKKKSEDADKTPIPEIPHLPLIPDEDELPPLPSFDETPKPSKFKINFGFKKEDKSSLPEQPKEAQKIRIKFPSLPKGKLNSPLDQFHKFNWNDFVMRLFSPYSRGKIHAWFFVLIIISSTYIMGKTLALFFSKSTTIVTRAPSIPVYPPGVDTTSQDINKIVTANLFNIKENEKAATGNVPKKDIASIVCNDADRPSTISAKVIDTVILQDSVKSVASVQVRGGSDLQDLREGDKIDNFVEISKITRQRLIVKNLQTGDCEYVLPENEETLPQTAMKIFSPKEGKALFKSNNPNIKNVGNNFKIKKAYRETMMNNISEILTQAKAIQITNPDGSLCFKMTEVVPGSLYTQLNIQENDIVCNINGKKIDNLNELMGFLGKVREIDNMQIGLNRNGMAENLEYNFE